MEVPARACHIHPMDGDLETPRFAPRPEKLGDGWLVIVTWPDGVQQQVAGFKTEGEAEDWIRKDAFAWLQQHPKMRLAQFPPPPSN